MKKLMNSLAAKVGAIILLVLMLWVCFAGVFAAVYMITENIYLSPSSALQETLSSRAYRDAYEIASQCYYSGDAEFPQGNMTYDVYCNNELVQSNVTTDRDSYPTGCRFTVELTMSNYDIYTVDMFLDPDMPQNDVYMMLSRMFDIVYSLRYSVYFIVLAALIAGVFLSVFLACAAGHRAGTDRLGGALSRIPFDIETAAVALAVFLGLGVLFELNSSEIGLFAVALVLVGSAIAVIVILYCMSLALRIKQGTLIRGTLIYKCLRWLGHILRALGRGIVALFRAVPLVWRTALCCCGVGLWLIMIVLLDGIGSRAVLMFGTVGLISVFAVYYATMLRRLELAAGRMAKGELEQSVNLSNMTGSLRRTGESLNSISVGMSAAVDERMRSERFKTELITNVSHDLKTPLTSIINYSDLIARETTDNENIKKYSAELTRQSERLKKLIIELVEASKAATGSIELDMAPCELNVLLTQAVGEYQQKLADNDLTMVSSIPHDNIRIIADAPRLWRVLDNLIGNALKYSQPGTRVYLSLTREGGRVLVILKNTSRTQLNIPADELMERFVRGDSSRHTEGNGLGLSIARSLTELMGGQLRLTVDGDLFKATLDFAEAK